MYICIYDIHIWYIIKIYWFIIQLYAVWICDLFWQSSLIIYTYIYIYILYYKDILAHFTCGCRIALQSILAVLTNYIYIYIYISLITYTYIYIYNDILTHFTRVCRMALRSALAVLTNCIYVYVFYIFWRYVDSFYMSMPYGSALYLDSVDWLYIDMLANYLYARSPCCLR